MADQSVGGNGQAVQRAVEITFNQVVVRYVFPALCGAAMLFAGIVGSGVLNAQKDMAEKIAAMQTDLAVLKNDMSYVKEKVRP